MSRVTRKGVGAATAMRRPVCERLKATGYVAIPTAGPVVDLLLVLRIPWAAAIASRRGERDGLLATGEDDTGRGGGCEWVPFTLR